MSIEEKAKEIIPNAFDNDVIFPVREGFIVNQQRFAFHHGAEWMKEEQKKASKILLFKAVKWIKEHASDYAWYDFEEYYPVFDVDRFIYDLKKAMEE